MPLNDFNGLASCVNFVIRKFKLSDLHVSCRLHGEEFVSKFFSISTSFEALDSTHKAEEGDELMVDADMEF